jgi:outer membrane protein OmpA-like peptidoglycan-associated protein
MMTTWSQGNMDRPCFLPGQIITVFINNRIKQIITKPYLRFEVKAMMPKSRTILISLILLFQPIWLLSQRQSHFPDTIVDAYNTLTKSKDKFFGGTAKAFGKLVPLTVLLNPSDTFVSLPTGSYVVLGFTDNYIEDAPGKPDIFIAEQDGAGEFAEVLVSADNVDYIHLGTAGNGKTNVFDLAKISYTGQVRFIKIIGNDANGQSPGFDVMNVRGLPGANVSKSEAPVVLENVLFETNKATLVKDASTSLDKLVKQLQQNQSMKIIIAGHTDSTGIESENLVLSERRAKAVLDYLVASGIDAGRLSAQGFGSAQPVDTNDTAEGRQKNRRVEFRKL